MADLRQRISNVFKTVDQTMLANTWRELHRRLKLLEVFKRLVHVNDSLILCDPFCVNIINNLFLLDRDIVTKITPSRKMGLCIFFMLYRV